MPVFNNSGNIRIGSAQVTQSRRGAATPWAAYNEASGGTVTTITNYNGTGQTWKVHRFNSNGTFTVTRSVGVYPFRVLIVGGGGGGGSGGGNQHGAGGNGGFGSDFTLNSLALQNHSITIGNGGGGNGNGSATQAFGYTANGGTAGAYMGGADTHGSTNGPNSNITGSLFQYGRFGGGVHYNWGYAAGPANTGQGGGGGQNTGGFGPGPGGSGVAIISYRVA